jgi:hypothetical protein
MRKQLKGIIDKTTQLTNLSLQLQSTMRQTTILTGIISSDMVLKRTNTYNDRCIYVNIKLHQQLRPEQ